MDDNQIPVEIIRTPPPVSSYFKTLSAALGVFVLVEGLGIAVKLSQQKQTTKTKASVDLVDLSLSPDKTQAGAGEEITFAVGMNPHNYKVTAVDLKLTYDSNLFDLISLTNAGFLPTTLAATGSSITLRSGVNPQTGAGVIANLILKVKANATGQTLVKVDPTTQVAGIDTNGQAVPTSILGDIPEVTIQFPLVKIGDANNDGKVDGADYTPWVLHYGETTANRALDGDFNEDGRVDGVDYSIWLLNYQ